MKALCGATKRTDGVRLARTDIWLKNKKKHLNVSFDDSFRVIRFYFVVYGWSVILD
jgi:hypothetical protein